MTQITLYCKNHKKIRAYIEQPAIKSQIENSWEDDKYHYYSIIKPESIFCSLVLSLMHYNDENLQIKFDSEETKPFKKIFESDCSSKQYAIYNNRLICVGSQPHYKTLDRTTIVSTLNFHKCEIYETKKACYLKIGEPINEISTSEIDNHLRSAKLS